MGNAAIMAALLAFALATSAAATHGQPARLYTGQQAKKGAAVYAQNCATCHGAKLQGKSGPAIGGTAFLKRTKLLGWSVENFRDVVVSTMPRSNPGSLTEKQYAQVLAYLLSVDCYPAGQTKFPTKATAKLKHTQMQTPEGAKPDNGKLGTCTLHGQG